MLRIPTEIKPSTIKDAGIGLFCIEAVKAGTLVWEFDQEFDVRLPALPNHPVIKDFVTTYGYLQADGTPGYVICLDNARFVNHANENEATLTV